MMSFNPSKRRRLDQGKNGASRAVSIDDPGNEHSQPTEENEDVLYSLIDSNQWEKAAARAKEKPHIVASCTKDPSMLALACRSGAPYFCIKEILDAAPRKLRHLVDSRGTPLHEAIVCEDIGPKAVAYLLRVDEELDKLPTDETAKNSSSHLLRAAMTQDVDGYTPLHLLIRRRFQAHVLADRNDTEKNNFMEILQLLVKSCAEAIVIPDRGEYEEPPIVMAIKANVYAPMLRPEETTTVRMERYIFDMVNCMLQHYPKAASRVFNGYRGQYTALHSAVFHGRSPDTIELLLNAEKMSPSNVNQKACLLGNTQRELPLHFCAMRGEPPRTVALLAKAAPEAIHQRDASGLTPIHWLWIRFVSTLLAVEDGRGNSITVPLRIRSQKESKNDSSQNFCFSSLEQDNFDADFLFLRKIDPTVDFLRMRHIPIEVQEAAEALQWAERSTNVLKSVQSRIESTVSENNDAEEDNHVLVLTRLEAITTLFWIKVISLLRAVGRHDSKIDPNHQNNNDVSLVRTAFVNGCCPPLVARIVALLLPREFTLPDQHGRIGLHYAAMRPWHAWDWPREDGTSQSAASKLLNLESATVLRNAISLSPVEAAKSTDRVGCLPIHYMISTCIEACRASGRSCSEDPVDEMLEIIGYFVKLNPQSLHVQDPRTGLLPYLQASAESSNAMIKNNNAATIHDEFPLSIVFLLLRQDPSLIRVSSFLQRGNVSC